MAYVKDGEIEELMAEVRRSDQRIRELEAERDRLREALIKVCDDLILYHPQADCLPLAEIALSPPLDQ